MRLASKKEPFCAEAYQKQQAHKRHKQAIDDIGIFHLNTLSLYARRDQRMVSPLNDIRIPVCIKLIEALVGLAERGTIRHNRSQADMADSNGKGDRDRAPSRCAAMKKSFGNARTHTLIVTACSAKTIDASAPIFFDMAAQTLRTCRFLRAGTDRQSAPSKARRILRTTMRKNSQPFAV